MAEAKWCIRPNALLSGRPAALYEDLSRLLDTASCTSYEAFKAYWREQKLDYLHHCLKARESQREFYELAWGFLLREFTEEREEIRTKCIFALYTLYMTQIRKPMVKITVDLPTWNAILAYVRRKPGQEAAMLQALVKNQAFSLGVFTGLRSIGPEIPENPTFSPRKPLKNEECDLITGLVDLPEFQSKQRAYNYAKHKAKAGLIEHLDWFPQYKGTKSTLQERLDSRDTALLELSDPTLSEKVENTLESVEFMKDSA